MPGPRFSIVTPAFRGGDWLPLCVASVADQGVSLEHLVQDSCSDDRTAEWLPHDPRVRAVIEKDRGMYDGVNRGLRRAQGEIVAYLNCDEQYLPGALARVDAYFHAHPAVDVVCGDVVAVDWDGRYAFSRKVLPPRLRHVQLCHLEPLTAAIFARREVFAQRGLWFDPALRDTGDADWVIRCLRAGVRFGALGAYTSVFAFTGANMSQGANAARENAARVAALPAWLRALRPAVKVLHRLRKLAAGCYTLPPFEYALYTRGAPDRRTVIRVDRPTPLWRPPA